MYTIKMCNISTHSMCTNVSQTSFSNLQIYWTVTGNSTTEYLVKGVTLKLRGAAVLAAVLDHLKLTTAISLAEELVLYGDRSKSSV